MQVFNTGNKFDLHRNKVIVIGLLLFLTAYTTIAQNTRRDNLTDYDEQWIHYGFAMGIHNSSYRIKYSDFFNNPLMDSVHSIVPENFGGFKLGFVINMRVAQFLDFRILPTVGFYENVLTYRYTDGTQFREVKDATMMEIPLLLKYKSQRRGNVAMYLVGGINTSFEAAGKGDEIDTREQLELRNFSVAIDVGTGFDLYFPLFKFSPELRYAYVLNNLLTDDRNGFSVNLDDLIMHNFTVFITFEGGPNYLKRKR